MIPDCNGDNVVMIGAAGRIVRENALEANCTGAEESWTRTVKLNVPEAVGVPLIAPDAAFNETPFGSAPEVTIQFE
jgi:hypothetical protein